MKKALVFIIIISFVSGCKNKEDSLNKVIEKNTQIYFENEFLSKDKYIALDSLKFVKRDTLTELDEGLMYFDYLSKNIKQHMEMVKNYQYEAELAKGISVTGFTEAKKNAQLFLDSSQMFLRYSNVITGKLAKLDTINPLYLRSRFFIQARLKNATIERDTIEVTSDLNGNLITTKQAINIASKKYK